MNQEARVITCNYIVATKTNSQGSKAYLIGGWSGGAWERLRVYCRSRSGRWIDKWENYRHFGNFRLTTSVPEQGGVYKKLSRENVLVCMSDTEKQKLCDYLNGGGWDTSLHNPKRIGGDA